MLRFPQSFVKRFWSRVRKTHGCWEWQGSQSDAGYGTVTCRSVSKQPLLTHRVSWELATGHSPRTRHVLHECDNPCCVRPDHLFLGTQQDNNEDRDAKGRVASGDRNGARTRPYRNLFVRNGGSGLCGEAHPQARLTEVQVKCLLYLSHKGVINRRLAERFGVSETHVGRLVRGESWRHLTS